ncbi:hypothetical protein JW964_23440 [candidate division KSB1 bacterium]|nr:hypothetical protein [candidate division KSB1 bacterium]
MSPEGQTPKGWWKNQVNQFTSQELSKKKGINIFRAAFGHWLDLFKFAIMFLAVFLAMQVILLGLEVLFTDITGIKLVAPLEKIVEQAPVVTETEEESTDSLAVATPVQPAQTDTESLLREYFGTASDEYPDFISANQFTLVLTINTIISLLLSLLVFYYNFYYLLSEDGQTFGMRSGKFELFRKDGRELASAGGIGGVGTSAGIVYSVFYLLFIPIFLIVTYFQLKYSFLWSFVEGFRVLDLAIAGNNIALNIGLTIGYWLLTLVILIGVAFIVGLVFHAIWFVAGLISNTLGKSEPETTLAL